MGFQSLSVKNPQRGGEDEGTPTLGIELIYKELAKLVVGA